MNAKQNQRKPVFHPKSGRYLSIEEAVKLMLASMKRSKSK